MMTFEQAMLEDAFAQIQKRFNSSDTDKQHEILIQLDPVAKKLEQVQVYRSQEEVLADIKKAMQGDRAQVFFAHSYVSWYRSYQNKKVQPQLHHWSQLDMKNRSLFIEMLGLRDLGRFDDEALYQFEQYCLSILK
mgnify:CR=1 FL=1